MRRLVEAEIAPVIDRGQAFVGLLRIMHAVIAMPARHQRRDHHLRADAKRLAHEVFAEFAARLDDDAAQLVAEGERPRQRLGPVALEDMKVGAAHSAGADLNERRVLLHLRPWHRADDRLGARPGEGGDADGAVAHGIYPSASQILPGITGFPGMGPGWRILARRSRSSIRGIQGRGSARRTSSNFRGRFWPAFPVDPIYGYLSGEAYSTGGCRLSG